MNKYLEPLQLFGLFSNYIKYQIPHTAWADDPYFKNDNIDYVIENLYTKFTHGSENNHGNIDFDIPDINAYFHTWFKKHSNDRFISEFYRHLNELGYSDKYTEEWYNKYALKETNKEGIMTIKLKAGQLLETTDGVIIETDENDSIVNADLKAELKESITDNPKSDIGSGWADIYRSTFIDSLSVFKNVDEVFVAKDLESAIEKSLKGDAVVLVTNAYKNVLRAWPVVDGMLLNYGMSDGSFIYTSNDIVMKGYSFPIRLMARIEQLTYVHKNT